jgi:hypothetical protein
MYESQSSVAIAGIFSKLMKGVRDIEASCNSHSIVRNYYHAFYQGIHAGNQGADHKRDSPYKTTDYRTWWMHGCIAGNGYRERTALMRVLESLLIEVEPLRFEQRQAIEKACDAKRKWADEHNARAAHSNDLWTYMSEYRRSLEDATQPLTKAVREANQVFDEIAALRYSVSRDSTADESAQ